MGRHQIAVCAGLLTVVAGTGVLAQEYPHAFPRHGATQIFDNDRVTIWEVVWHHNVDQPYHRHLYDMTMVYLREGSITVTPPPDAPPARPAATPPAAAPSGTAGAPGGGGVGRNEGARQLFQLKGITHKEVGSGKPNEPERFGFATDLKGYSPVYPAPKDAQPAFPREGAAKGIDSERVVFWDHTWTPGKPTPMHFHDKDRVEVFVTGGTLRIRTADGKTETQTVAPWSARFVEGGRSDVEEAVGEPIRAVTIELKQAK